MSTWHPTTKAAEQPTHETVPIRTNQIRLNCGTAFHGGSRNGTNLNQDPPHQHPTPKRSRPHPQASHMASTIWHTVEFSRNRRASPRDLSISSERLCRSESYLAFRPL